MLKQEFSKRESELKKLEQAEERMNGEKTMLNEKINKMRQEIDTKFVKAEQKRDESERKAVQLKMELKNYKDKQ